MEMEWLLDEQDCAASDLAPTVPAALDAIARQRPDAVVLDLNLNGDPTTAIAEALNNGGIPFVVVTGYVQAALDEPALRGRLILQKPWRGEELLSRLSQVIDAAAGP